MIPEEIEEIWASSMAEFNDSRILRMDFRSVKPEEKSTSKDVEMLEILDN